MLTDTSQISTRGAALICAPCAQYVNDMVSPPVLNARRTVRRGHAAALTRRGVASRQAARHWWLHQLPHKAAGVERLVVA
jgi:hypothetical protein